MTFTLTSITDLRYTAGSNTNLFAIPVLVTNYQDRNGNNVNSGSDRTRWQLVRRFYLVDNQSGKQVQVTSKCHMTLTSVHCHLHI